MSGPNLTPGGQPKRSTPDNERDMLEEQERHLREEAPAAYKDLRPVVDAVVAAAAARKVARLEPLLTVKG